ncbi:Protein PAL OF QUIRKY [Cardamine amara subsp. amara]|uniref:Protein PAL OF QUIRKY n=1 Tax=Cardamine amara subsp. amara TaxID=228776 RepID=A0ABD1BFQ3_CARAN
MTNPTTVKFLCSYGGRITPRYSDGKLRYQGGDTRVLSVSRSISFTELAKKLSEICGVTVSTLRCQLPTDDLDALVTVTSDEDLANLMEEYDLASTAQVKIHVFLSPLKSTTNSSSTASSSSSSKSSSRSPPSSPTRETCQTCVERSMRNNGCYVHRSPSHNQFYLIHN